MSYFSQRIVWWLLGISVVAIGFWGVRVVVSGRWRFYFLVWNLFLAWLPLLFAWLAWSVRQQRPLFLCFAFLWLLFLPNAPYILTDLIHLRRSVGLWLWYDLGLILAFAFAGLLPGFYSLRMGHIFIERRFGWLGGWLFTCTLLGLSGWGVYIGRVLGWNSWDLFSNPLHLGQDMLVTLLAPRPWVLSGLLGAMLVFSYIFLIRTLPLGVSPAS